jgi:hypothetical protein
MNRKKENGERSILVYYCGKKGQNSDSLASGTLLAPRMSQCLSVSLLTEN